MIARESIMVGPAAPYLLVMGPAFPLLRDGRAELEYLALYVIAPLVSTWLLAWAVLAAAKRARKR